MSPEPTLDFRNVNTLWCSVLIETLARCGVRHAVVSPGSRSTPVTMALAAHAGVEAIPVLDERSAGFFALGLAKRTGRPALLVCTSGTAGANYFPAVIEARESGVPLIVLTADRPPEMRECASGQTIDQQKLFGAYPVFYHELSVPEARLELLAYLRQTIAQAVRRAARGPVHLNAPFRDPLPPLPTEAARGLEGKIGAEFFGHLGADAADGVETRTVLWQRPTTARGIIVAGPAAPADVTYYVTKVLGLGEALGWPVLADVLSPVRQGATPGAVVTAYDAILRNAELARALTPRMVLCLGGWPTSKVLRQWLEASQAEIVLVAPGGANRDALHGKTRQIEAEATMLAVEGRSLRDEKWVAAWGDAERRARAVLDGAIEAETEMFEPKAAWLTARHAPADTTIFVANSMPVRDVEYFWPATARGPRLMYSRGANGIDGTLSTAMGVAQGGGPAILLTGDLALLHDSNGFLNAGQLKGSLTVVLIDNRGGGIFEHLPVAAFDPPFERFWATPQQVDFGKLCAAHGVPCIEVGGWDEFVRLIAELPERGVRVLRVATDRKADAAKRKRLFAEAARAAG